MTRDNALALGLVFLSVLWSIWTYGDTPSPDLLATWLAAEAFAEGRLGDIYAPVSHVYTMQPPEAWLGAVEGQIFPFVYPPLWAALVAPLTQVTDFESFKTVAIVLDPLLLGMTVWLAGRLAGRLGDQRLAVWVYTAIGLAVLHFTMIGVSALDQDQPQILVSFLILLSLERASARFSWIAGAAMALAAAIKLYPVFFALVWMVRGRRKTPFAFVVCGAALAAGSVALAGWPLHETFLMHVRAIGNTAFVNSFVFAFDPLIARIAFPEDLTFIPSLGDGAGGWAVMAKGPLWQAVSALALVVAIFATKMGRGPMVWAWFAVAIGLLSPISWGYHYITAMAFLPALLVHYPKRGLFYLLIIAAPVSTPVLLVLDQRFDAFWLMPGLGTCAMLLAGILFWIAARRRKDG